MSDSPTPTRPNHVLEDPSAKAVARVYATAFLNAAGKENQSELLEEFTSFHDDVLKPHPEIERMLMTGATGSDEKRGFIERVVEPVASKTFTNFLHVLAKHERLELIPLILSETWEMYEKQQGQLRIKLKSAVALNDGQLDRIKNRLKDALSSEPILMPTVDEELLGGLVVQVGDTVYDGSLRTRLRDLQSRLRERYLNEIQIGRDRFSSPEGN